MEKMIENLVRVLFKIGGISDDQVREMFDKGQSIIIDGHAQIAMMNNRLARIERHLGIVPETPVTKLEDHSQ